MNRKTIGRILLMAWLGALFAFAMTNFSDAQALPVPTPAGGINGPSLVLMTPEPITPINGQIFTFWDQLQWHDIGADRYILKFKNTRTGETLRYGLNAPDVCADGVCTATGLHNILFPIVRDGDKFKWYVTAEFDYTLHIKGGAAIAFVNEVETPGLISPLPGAQLSKASASHSFQWDSSGLADLYTLIVKDKTTGQLAYKDNAFPSSICASGMCTYFFLAYQMPWLEVGHEYKWKVKMTSFTGEKATSVKWSFVATD